MLNISVFEICGLELALGFWMILQQPFGLSSQYVLLKSKVWWETLFNEELSLWAQFLSIGGT